jgi:hypothetical protein
MPNFQLPQFDDIALLRSIQPNRLRIFLKRFDNYLLSQGFTIPETAVFTDAHLQQLISIFNTHDGATPADMIEALFHISETANDQSMESLLLVATKTGIELPEGDITPADVALLVWLHDPDLLRRANCERIVLRSQSFYCYMNRTLEVPKFELPSDTVLKTIEERTNQFNRNRQRGGGAAVWMYQFSHEIAFLIRFGGPLKREEVMDNDQCRPDIRRPVGYDLVVYNQQTGELRIRADLVSERRFYCQVFSEQLFGDPAFFEHGETFNLDVIYQLGEDVQSPGMVPGIKSILLLEIQEVLLGERALHITLKSEAIFQAIREHNRRLTPSGRLLSAKFKVSLEHGVDVIVTICSGNKIRLSRQVGLSAINQWLVHHGIRVPQHATLPMSATTTVASHQAYSKPQGSKIPLASRTG